MLTENEAKQVEWQLGTWIDMDDEDWSRGGINTMQACGRDQIDVHAQNGKAVESSVVGGSGWC